MNNVDSIRLEQFRQIRKEIRGSNEYLVVGIDIAKDKHCAFYVTATGKTLLKRLIFENSIEGFDKLRIQEDALKVRYGLEKVIYGLEPTGNYHKPLGEHLIKCCRNVVLVSGAAVKNNRKMIACRSWCATPTPPCTRPRTGGGTRTSSSRPTRCRSPPASLGPGNGAVAEGRLTRRRALSGAAMPRDKWISHF